MPEIGMEISKIESKGLTKEEEAAEKEELFRDFGIKSERIHTLNQLLKAYALFEKDIQYVVMDNKVMIVDEQTVVSWMDVDIVMVCTKLLRPGKCKDRGCHTNICYSNLTELLPYVPQVIWYDGYSRY